MIDVVNGKMNEDLMISRLVALVFMMTDSKCLVSLDDDISTCKLWGFPSLCGPVGSLGLCLLGSTTIVRALA